MKMGKAFVVAVVLILAVVFVASCTSTPSPTPTPTTPAQTTPASSPKPTTPAQTTPASSPSPTKAAETIKFTLTGMFSGEMPIDQQIVFLLQEASKQSGIPVTIDKFWLENLAKSNEHLQAVQNGLADLAYVGLSYWPKSFPIGMIPNSLPNGTNNDLVMLLANDDFYRNWDPMNAEWTSVGVKFLSTGIYGPNILMGNKKITSLADFKGARIRTWGLAGRVHVELGAIPVTLTMAEALDALTKGTVDLTIGHMLTSAKTMSMHEVSRYFNLVNNGSLPIPIIMSLKKWNSLPPAFQQALIKVGQSEDVYKQWRKVSNDMMLDYMNVVKKSKCELVYVPGLQPQMDAVAYKLWDTFKTEWKDTPVLAQALDRYVAKVRELEKKYGTDDQPKP